MADLLPILALGAHPDDIEFGCGAILAQASADGRPCHLVVCSRGEASTNGTPAQRTREARAAARILGGTLEFITFKGDAHLKPRTEYAFTLATLIRRLKPAILLAPTLVKNQHPDHAALGSLAQMAARLARYGGIKRPGLRKWPPHAIDTLFYYAITPDAEPRDIPPVLFDISAPEILSTWTRAMQAHASQMRTRNYVELQLARARVNGLRAGVQHAMALFPNDPLLFASLRDITASARSF